VGLQSHCIKHAKKCRENTVRQTGQTRTSQVAIYQQVSAIHHQLSTAVCVLICHLSDILSLPVVFLQFDTSALSLVIFNTVCPSFGWSTSWSFTVWLPHLESFYKPVIFRAQQVPYHFCRLRFYATKYAYIYDRLMLRSHNCLREQNDGS